jgi:hypothetical protein
MLFYVNSSTLPTKAIVDWMMMDDRNEVGRHEQLVLVKVGRIS